MNISSLFAYEHIVDLMVTTSCSQTNMANHSFIGKSLAFLPQRYFVKYSFIKNYLVIHHLKHCEQERENTSSNYITTMRCTCYLGRKRCLASLSCLHLNVILFKIRWTASHKLNHVLLVTLKSNKRKE